MPGDETKGFDLVMEFSEEAIQKYLKEIFDNNGTLCQLLQALNLGGLCGAFLLDVSLDRPTDVTIPTGELNVLDVGIHLGDDGSLGDLRFVAGVDVDRSNAGFDLPRINLAQRLFHAEASVEGVPLPQPLVTSAVASLGAIPFIPMVVDRNSTEPIGLPTRLDTRIIDDPSASDLDAWAAMLTFGGGSPGDATAFSRSFVPEGSDNAIAFSFGWFCRVISPALDEALDLGGAFTDCRLTRPVQIADDPDVDLTRFELRLREDFIEVIATVRNTGPCYSVTATVSAAITLEVENGELVVKSEVGEPDFDVNIPWYCWVAGAAILAFLGGLLFGIVGQIVGGIIIPLIVWFSVDLLESKVQEGLQRVTDFLNEFAPDVRVEAVGFNLVFQDAFIDDISIGGRIQMLDRAPVRSEGTLLVRSGEHVDLDSGKVGTETLPSSDLEWRGSGFFGVLRTTCNAALGRTGLRSFATLTRATLYSFDFASPTAVSLLELADIDPLGALTGDYFDETMRVFAVRTSEGRYAAFQAIKVDPRSIRLRYRTYEKFLPGVEILGEFSCLRPPSITDVSDVIFESFLSSPAVGSTSDDEVAGQTQAPDFTRDVRETCQAFTRAQIAGLPREFANRAFYENRPLVKRRIGTWKGRFRYGARNVGRFDAITSGLRSPLLYVWEIEGTELQEGTGQEVHVKGVTIGYSLSGNRLQLVNLPETALEFELAVGVSDEDGVTVTTTRCLHYEPICEETGRYIPDWKTYREAHLQHFGIVELPAGTQDDVAVSPSPRP